MEGPGAERLTTCGRCGLGRERSAFDTKHLERLLLHKELANAVLLILRLHGFTRARRDATHLQSAQKDFTLECVLSRGAQEAGCEQMKVRRIPAPLMQSVRTPAKPLTHDIGDLCDYICQTCFRPACAGGCGRESLTNHRGRRGYNVFNVLSTVIMFGICLHGIALRVTPEAGRRIIDLHIIPPCQVLNAAREEHFAKPRLKHISWC
ncbi:hypothetical protein N9L68_00355 [bacterium]|nr:hypothetical protein [bacterium]